MKIYYTCIHVSLSGLYCSHGDTCGCVTDAWEPPGQTFWEHQRDLEIQQVSKHARPYCCTCAVKRGLTIVLSKHNNHRVGRFYTYGWHGHTIYRILSKIFTNFSAPLRPNCLLFLARGFPWSLISNCSKILAPCRPVQKWYKPYNERGLCCSKLQVAKVHRLLAKAVAGFLMDRINQ